MGSPSTASAAKTLTFDVNIAHFGVLFRVSPETFNGRQSAQTLAKLQRAVVLAGCSFSIIDLLEIHKAFSVA